MAYPALERRGNPEDYVTMMVDMALFRRSVFTRSDPHKLRIMKILLLQGREQFLATRTFRRHKLLTESLDMATTLKQR